MADSPGLSDDVAITALIISVIALLIGISSFLQAILGTAEGYRRCARSVIGPWSALRKRVFRWSEFRFETKFVIPLIVLVTSNDAAGVPGSKYADDVYLLNEHEDEEETKSGHNPLFNKYDIRQVLQESLHLPEFKRTFPSKVDEQSRHHEKESPDLYNAEKGHNTQEGAKQRTSGRRFMKSDPRNALPVTWIRLLHDLHILYLNYWPNERCNSQCQPDTCSDLEVAPQTSPQRLSTRDGRMGNVVRTRVAIVPIMETWDFMPPDVARPLATSTIGNVLVLALRLGMQWRSLDRARSQMNADGNGYSISSTDVKGLGMVLKFYSFGNTKHDQLVIPSRAADKLMCGIVPGDSTLVRQDFELINRDRKLVELWEDNGIYQKLGLDDKTIDMLQAQNRFTTHNEVITLLCAFLPLPASHLNGFFFSGWKTRQYSLFHFFEPRLAFLLKLRSMTPGEHTDITRQMHKALEDLFNRFHVEFCNGYSKERPATTAPNQRKLDLMAICAELVNETTNFFVSKGYSVKPDNTDKTWYLQLVAAHARLSAYANSKFDPAQYLSQQQILEKRRGIITEAGVETKYFAEHLWNQTQLYINGLDDPEYGVVQYMTSRAFTTDKTSLKDAWWMLMLRGIAWDMSCKCLAYPGEPVISSYYHDETSVWFT